MERTKLLDCIVDGKKVLYREHSYIPTAYIMRHKNNQWLHSAELLDNNKNSIIVANLNQIKECET